jgi:hypothetical protein
VTGAQLLVPGVTRPTLNPGLEREWIAVVHQMAREVGGRVRNKSEPPPPGPQRNYYRQHVTLPGGEQTFVLLNASIRLVACQRQGRPGELVLPFLDVPRSDLYELVGLCVGPREELEQELRPEDIVGLDPDEVRDVEYHRPPRVGDVIYNWFD